MTRLRRIAWMLLAAGIGLTACRSSPVTRRTPPPPVGAQALLDVPAADLPSWVEDRYRLRPDRRWLEAVAIVAAPGSAGEARPAQASYAGGRWRVMLGDEVVGELSEVPGFVEATTLLIDWARRVGPATATASGEASAQAMRLAVAEADPEGILEQLALTESPSVAASGYSWLSWLAIDATDRADPLRASAWAWVALDKAVRDGRATQPEVLTARSLGYDAEAAELARDLGPDDPVGSYARGDAAQLAASCVGTPDRACRLLRLALLAESERSEAFEAALEEAAPAGFPGLALAGLRLEAAGFDERVSRARAAAVSALAGVVTSAEAADRIGERAPAASAGDFETALRRFAAERSRGLLGARAVRAYFDAAFYAGLVGEARFLLESLASGAHGARLAAQLSEQPTPAAEELSAWVELGAQRLQGDLDVDAAIELLSRAETLGGAALCDLAESVAREVSPTDPRRRKGLPELFARLDTRPEHRRLASRVARRSLASVGLHERLARAAVAAAPYRSSELAAAIAAMDGDLARLREIADDPAMSSHARSSALYRLAESGDDSFVRPRYEAMASDPDGGLSPLIAFLEARQDLPAALAAVDTALAEGPWVNALKHAYLLTERARLLGALGRDREAYEAIRPALVAGREETYLVGAELALAVGRSREALELARQASDRYPERSWEAMALAVRAHWQDGDPSAAAREAMRRPSLLGPWSLGLPRAFAAAFADSTDAGAVAFRHLQDAGVHVRSLALTAIEWGRAGQLDAALALLRELRDPSPEWQLQTHIDTWQMVRDVDGDEVARSWLEATFPDPEYDLALGLYQAREHEILLDVFAPGVEAGKPAIVRLMRVASMLHLGQRGSESWLALVDEIDRQPADGSFFVIAARVLAGLDDEGTLLRPLRDLGDAADLGWAMGLHSASHGRFAAADAWLQVALESGQAEQPPHAWAWGIENHWLQSRSSLAALEAAGRF